MGQGVKDSELMGSVLSTAQRKAWAGASEGTNLEEPIEPDALGGSGEPKDGVELQHV